MKRGGLFILVSLISATVILSTQLALTTIASFSFFDALLASTAAGFVVRYVLDVVITHGSTIGAGQKEVRRAASYLMTSIAATLVYWALAYSGHLLELSASLQMVASTVGLLLGLALKYCLDVSLTFKRYLGSKP